MVLFYLPFTFRLIRFRFSHQIYACFPLPKLCSNRIIKYARQTLSYKVTDAVSVWILLGKAFSSYWATLDITPGTKRNYCEGSKTGSIWEFFFVVQPVVVCYDWEKVVLNAWSVANWWSGVTVMIKRWWKRGWHLAVFIINTTPHVRFVRVKAERRDFCRRHYNYTCQMPRWVSSTLRPIRQVTC
jgi:hypothetical protein